MDHLRFRLALAAGKITASFLKLMAGRGTNIPGVIMKKICPDVLARFQMPRTVICVTGTNGKTGTSNLLTHLLRCGGLDVVNNSEGSNMETGLITALAKRSDFRGRVEADAAVLEVDERSSPYIYTKITPTYLLCTNLFRDSIKRNGHSEYIFHKMDDYLPESTVLLLNGNDPISGLLGQGRNQQIYYAVDRTSESTENCENITCDCKVCPQCHRPLKYEYYHYHHIGKPVCSCGFRMPAPAYSAKDVDYAAGTFTFCEDCQPGLTLPFSGGNLFQVFNTTAAVAMCRLMGMDPQRIRQGVQEFASIGTRFADSEMAGHRVVTMLCKNQNPVSSSRSIAYLNHVEGTKDVVLLITDSKDKVHGSEDISWLYDTDFDALKGEDVHRIFLGGTRCRDLALRLYLAGVDSEKLALFPDYGELCTRISGLTAPGSTAVIYYELYAFGIAQQVKQALGKEDAK
ncbi:MAG: MurT ligase domain-containing protein [Firmicutes bacterium]|nr:MurT ligase domain-containing protein [Bacillota bacterium]